MMAVNNLIAHGIQGVGQDVPNILQATDQRNRQNALMAMQQDQSARVSDQDRRQAFMELGMVADRILKLPDARQRRAAAQQATQVFARQFAATGVQSGGDINALSDQQLDEALTRMATFAQQGPQQPPEPLEQTVGPDGNPVLTRRSQAAGMRPYIKPEKSEKAPSRYRAMSPQEVQAAGLPPGTSAQVNDEGKIDVLSKRDATGNLSQKDQTTAKMKLNTVKLARAQLQRIKEAFTEGTQGVNAFGPGQGLLPTPAGKKFDARVNQMRSTLTALTRVPGVGAMSDYETRLDQAKFPERNAWESVTADVLAGLDDQLRLIETGYTDLLNGGQVSAPEGPAAAPSGGPVRVNTPEEAMALPPGTQFVTPDGRVKVRP